MEDSMLNLLYLLKVFYYLKQITTLDQKENLPNREYKFSELNIIERIDQYGNDIHYSSEYFDEIGNLIKYIPVNLRDTREELHIDYDYDTNKYPLVESRSKLFFYRDSLLEVKQLNIYLTITTIIL